jgi:hypothetical protein
MCWGRWCSIPDGGYYYIRFPDICWGDCDGLPGELQFDCLNRKWVAEKLYQHQSHNNIRAVIDNLSEMAGGEVSSEDSVYLDLMLCKSTVELYQYAKSALGMDSDVLLKILRRAQHMSF